MNLRSPLPVVAVLSGLASVLTSLMVLLDGPDPAAGPDAAVLGASAGGASGEVRTTVWSGAPGGTRDVGPGRSREVGTGEAVRIIAAWDRARSRAYASGELRALEQAYLTGSDAGAEDARVLRGYRERGLRVVGMRTQLLAVRLLDQTRQTLTLRVTDLLGSAVAVGDGGRFALPRDRAGVTVVDLVRDAEGTWVVAEVIPVAGG